MANTLFAFILPKIVGYPVSVLESDMRWVTGPPGPMRAPIGTRTLSPKPQAFQSGNSPIEAWCLWVFITTFQNCNMWPRSANPVVLPRPSHHIKCLHFAHIRYLRSATVTENVGQSSNASLCHFFVQPLLRFYDALR